MPTLSTAIASWRFSSVPGRDRPRRSISGFAEGAYLRCWRCLYPQNADADVPLLLPLVDVPPLKILPCANPAASGIPPSAPKCGCQSGPSMAKITALGITSCWYHRVGTELDHAVFYDEPLLTETYQYQKKKRRVPTTHCLCGADNRNTPHTLYVKLYQIHL